jgi:UDP-N-acetyl-2-amino-2-deoxyglucuronate dehydrogenase
LRNVPADIGASIVSDENQSASSATVSDFRGHQALFEDFIRAIEQDGDPVCNGREGRRSIALIEALYQAARSSGT